MVVILIVGAMTIISLTVLIYLLARNARKLNTLNKSYENKNQLNKTFIDADNRLIYLKDENLKYVFVNNAFEKFYSVESKDVIGTDDFALTCDEFADKRRKTDLAVLEQRTRIVDRVEWEGRVYRTTKFPVQMINGNFGVGAYIKDITQEWEHEKRQDKSLHRHMILTDVLTRSFNNTHEQLDYVLSEALRLTESQYGYIYLYDEVRRELTLSSWTNGVMDTCEVTEKQTKYQLDKTGIWGEVIRQRKPIIVNDFEKDHPLKKGYPEGHVKLKRFISVPVFIDGKIVATIGLANKPSIYDSQDVYEVSLLMSGAWYAVGRREAQEALAFERNRYLQTLVSIGDGVLVVDKNGCVEMLNTIAEELTGWKQSEAAGKHYKQVFILSHEQEGEHINDPIQQVFESDQIVELGNHAMLTSKDGKKYYLEDSAAPIKDDAGATRGVVLVFRDISDKKEQRQKIEYLSYHDTLTGLYNRRYFEHRMSVIDTKHNLPISIIMGDVNGLKLTNDIFGHAAGDILLEKVTKVIKAACRKQDIVARWGGDEFIIMLPKTDSDVTQSIVSVIKENFAKEQIKAIKGSISMGIDTKYKENEDIFQVLSNAEEKMYMVKTLERDKMRDSTLEAIVLLLHQNSNREKEHALRVSELSVQLGQQLGLSEVKIRKLKEAAYLHDIGKIAIDPKILNKNYNLSDEEWTEMKKHTTAGYRILNSFDQTLDLAEAVLGHHERWDGKGYPRGMKGIEIPIIARIISIIESYERMVHDSDNTKAKKPEQAIEEIRKHAGAQFDPEIAEAFAKMIESSAL